MAARLFGAMVALPALVGPALSAPLQPHLAVYDITLDKAAEQTGIDAMDGRLVFEFSGSACEGYTTNMRFVLRMQLPDAMRVTDQQTATYEKGDGSEFNFVTRTFTDQKLDREIKGSATRTDEGVEVDLDKPDDIDISMEKSLFPTMHLQDLLEKAKAGENFYETTMYDGSDDGDRTVLTSVIIGKQGQDKAGGEDDAGAKLDGSPWWPVSIAYFDKLKETGGEELPQYRINFKLYENGVTRDLLLDYGDFVLNGDLKSLELRDRDPSCAQ